MNEKLKLYLCEFIGAFCVALFTCCIFMVSDPAVAASAALASGMCYMAVTALFLPISGAHLNPAVSLAQLIKGKLDVPDFFGYMAAQLLGVFAGLGFAALIEGDRTTIIVSEISYLSPWSALLMEIVCSFVFVFIYLEVTRRSRGSTVTPLIIGGAMTFILAWTMGLTGSMINPFRGFAAVVISGDVSYVSDLWIFIIAPFIGGALAGFAQPKVFDLDA